MDFLINLIVNLLWYNLLNVFTKITPAQLALFDLSRQKQAMDIETFSIAGPILFTPKRHKDARGFFSETFKLSIFEAAVGKGYDFVQDNLSASSAKDTIRGLHYQAPPHAQGKLVSCQRGSITDVIIDIRKSSPSYGQHLAVDLSAETRAQLWVPPAFLHGYVTREDNCEILYKVTDYYAPETEGSVRWDDPDLAIDWKAAVPALSERDKQGQIFSQFESPFL